MDVVFYEDSSCRILRLRNSYAGDFRVQTHGETNYLKSSGFNTNKLLTGSASSSDQVLACAWPPLAKCLQEGIAR